jgi:hypothetical protein
MKKIILTKEQKTILSEQIGVDNFLVELSEKQPDSVYIMKFLTDFIKKSGCERIEFSNFKLTAHGASLIDRVLINREILNYRLDYILYVIFHEIAHQFQYRKYGRDKMYDLYLGDFPIHEGAIWLKNIEEVADDFAFRKLRELSKKTDKIKINFNVLKKNYDNTPIFMYEQLIKYTISLIKNEKWNDKDDISEILYNNIVNVKK